MDAMLSPAVPVPRIVDVVAKLMAQPRDAITGDSRRSDVMRARLVAYGVARAQGWSLPDIGRGMGGRDHSTVLSGLRRLDALLPVDARLRAAHDAALRYVDLTAPGPDTLRAAVIARVCDASLDELSCVARMLGVQDGG